MPKSVGGSATRWGPLLGARAVEWAETWEGPAGWGTLAYHHVLDRVEIGPSSRVLDCGCGAGRSREWLQIVEGSMRRKN